MTLQCIYKAIHDKIFNYSKTFDFREISHYSETLSSESAEMDGPTLYANLEGPFNLSIGYII